MKDPNISWEEYAKNLETSYADTEKHLKKFEAQVRALEKDIQMKLCKLGLKQAEVFEFVEGRGMLNLAQAMSLVSEVSRLCESIPDLWDETMKDECPF